MMNHTYDQGNRMMSLGRRVEHDPRSKSFSYIPAATTKLRTVRHRHRGVILHQGKLASSTGFALVQALNSFPLYAQRGKILLNARDALKLYSRATNIDVFNGRFPPVDRGTSGLSVCKAACNMGLLAAYRHTFNMAQTLITLVEQPVIVGSLWYEGMFNTDKRGFVHITGRVVGGHEYVLVGLDIERKFVVALNSWGGDWGIHGAFRLPWNELETLLHMDGDVIVPLV